MNLSRTRALLASALLALPLLAACGEDEQDPSTPPALSSARVTCQPAAQGSNVDYEVVREVSVLVEDADGDLLRVQGSLNGIVMGNLEDADADLRFNWTPPASLDPIVCKGELNLRFEAIDQAGNQIEYVEIVTK